MNLGHLLNHSILRCRVRLVSNVLIYGFGRSGHLSWFSQLNEQIQNLFQHVFLTSMWALLRINEAPSIAVFFSLGAIGLVDDS